MNKYIAHHRHQGFKVTTFWVAGSCVTKRMKGRSEKRNALGEEEKKLWQGKEKRKQKKERKPWGEGNLGMETWHQTLCMRDQARHP